MNTKMETLANKIFKSTFWKYAEAVLLTGLFFLLILCLANYDNTYYQVPKYMKEAQFLTAMTAILFLVRRVRLFNWQSLVATVVFIPLTLFQLYLYREMSEIAQVVLYRLPFYWLTVMIIIDLYLYKGINKPKKEHALMLLLYVCMTVWMLFNRNTRNDPLYLVFPFGLMMLIRITKEDWEKLFLHFINGWFLVYLYAVIRSFVTNPYKGGRYYGYFVNIGSFGTFLCCAFIVALIAILYSKSKFGRKSFFYVGSLLWILSDMFMCYITSTRTLLIGILFALLTLFFVDRKDISKKATIRRICIIVGVAALLVAIYLVVFFNAKSLLRWSVVKKYKNGGLLSPLYVILNRMRNLNKQMDRSNIWTILWSSLDILSSNRLTIIREFGNYFNFSGNSPMYLEIESIDYVAVSTHNTYAQCILDYGYGVAALYFSFVIGGLIVAVRNFLKRGRQVIDRLPLLWIPMTLGAWLGESCWMNFPITFFMIFLICRMISEPEEEKVQPEEGRSNLEEA